MTRYNSKETTFKIGDCVRVLEDTYTFYYDENFKPCTINNEDKGKEYKVRHSMFDLLGSEMVSLADCPRVEWYWSSEIELIDCT